MANNYTPHKIKLISCFHMVLTGIFLFSFFLGLSMVGTASAAASSIPSSAWVGGQELQEVQQLQISWITDITGGTDANTTVGMIAANISSNNNGNSTTGTGLNTSTTQNQTRYQEAIVQYDKVLAINANNTDALTGKGLALQALEEEEEEGQTTGGGTTTTGGESEPESGEGGNEEDEEGDEPLDLFLALSFF